jgi:hypothetical protein
VEYLAIRLGGDFLLRREISPPCITRYQKLHWELKRQFPLNIAGKLAD